MGVNSRADHLLVGVSPQGKILFISPSYPGSNNDEKIAKLTRAQWYDCLELDEWVIGDSGFNSLSASDWRVITPNSNIHFYKKLSSVRIIVENAFAQIKKWGACREKIRSSGDNVLQLHQKYWSVASIFCNHCWNRK